MPASRSESMVPSTRGSTASRSGRAASAAIRSCSSGSSVESRSPPPLVVASRSPSHSRSAATESYAVRARSRSTGISGRPPAPGHLVPGDPLLLCVDERAVEVGGRGARAQQAAGLPAQPPAGVPAQGDTALLAVLLGAGGADQVAEGDVEDLGAEHLEGVAHPAPPSRAPRPSPRRALRWGRVTSTNTSSIVLLELLQPALAEAAGDVLGAHGVVRGGDARGIPGVVAVVGRPGAQRGGLGELAGQLVDPLPAEARPAAPRAPGPATSAAGALRTASRWRPASGGR